MPATTIRVKPPGDSWMVVGVDVAAGVVPEGVSLTSNEWGPDRASFTVRRDATLPWRDLLPFAEVEVEVAGAGVVWGGRVWDTQYADAQTISVVCLGWQYALDDNQMMRLWVHDRLSDWRDIREYASASLVEYQANLNPSNNGVVTFSLGGNVLLPVYNAGGRSGFYLDGGETGAIKRVVITWESANNTSSIKTYLFESDTDPSSAAVNTAIAAWNGGASGTFTRTLPTARRYVSIVAQNDTAGDYTPLGATWFRVTDVKCFRDTAYESGNASILKASDVIKNVRSALLGSVLSTDETLVTTSSTSIPHLTTEGGYQTPRQILQAVNAYHDWLIGVGADKRLFFTSRPTSPVIEIGEWSGADFSDAGDSGEELYNRVLVTGTGADGQPLLVERTATSSLLSAAGITRAKSLSVTAATTTTIAQVIGDAWLATRSARPTRGSVTVRGLGGARNVTSGAAVHPAEILRYPGQRMRLAHRWDPDTGAWGRDASITSVTYTPDTDTASITLDSPRDRLDVLLGRLAAVRGAGQPLQ